MKWKISLVLTIIILNFNHYRSYNQLLDKLHHIGLLKSRIIFWFINVRKTHKFFQPKKIQTLTSFKHNFTVNNVTLSLPLICQELEFYSSIWFFMWQPHNYPTKEYSLYYRRRERVTEKHRANCCWPVSGSAIFLDLGLHKSYVAY